MTLAIREAPLGISLFAALLSIGGAGLIAAGLFLPAGDGRLGSIAAAASVVMGAAILYFSYELIRLARWTWLALAVVITLLTLSSVARLFVAPGVPSVIAFELILELAAAFYISRSAIRASFGWLSR